jgi:hypothetical protein
MAGSLAREGSAASFFLMEAPALALPEHHAKISAMSQDFLSRWSNRKLKRAGDPSVAAPETTVVPAPDENEITPEELAALPAVEDITATTDLAAFLKKGVPLVLRNAVFRRMWALDPEIRDFVGDARDYAWDWNTPGGVPVSGPLEPGTDIQGMLRRIIGGDETPPDARENVIGEAAPVAPREQPPRQPASLPETAENSEPEPEDESSETEGSPIRGRHGGALPA